MPLNRGAFWQLIEAFPGALRLGARSLWLEILMRARQYPGAYDGVELDRGQFAFGVEKIGAVCGLTRQQMRTLLKWSMKLGKLTIEATNHGSVGTVMNFNSYVPPNPAANQARNQQATNGQPTDNHIQQDTSSKRTEKNDSPSGRSRDEFMDRMMQLWQECWPELEAPQFSLLGLWRKEYGEVEVLAMTRKVGLAGKKFATGADLTSYLAGALSNESERRVEQEQDSGDGHQPFIIADPLGEPVTDPEQRHAKIKALSLSTDPDQGYWFTIPDDAVRSGTIDDATRQMILENLPNQNGRKS